MKRLLSLLIALLLLAGLLPHTAAASAANPKQSGVPMVTTVLQIAPDTLKITYDRVTDLKKATDPNNYWVQDVTNDKPSGIATFGKNDTTSSKNTLAQAFATITPFDSSKKVFLIKFNDTIVPGSQYKLIVCFITAPNAPAFTSDNGKIDFTGK